VLTSRMTRSTEYGPDRPNLARSHDLAEQAERSGKNVLIIS
jgi:hypothetical protein